MFLNGPDPSRGLLFRLAVVSLFLQPGALPAKALQVTGVPGSPSATTTIPDNQLRAPPPPFGGEIAQRTTGDCW